jgi:hypothetical protein
MRKIVLGWLTLAAVLGLAPAAVAQSPSPIGLYGHWSSARYPGAGGDLKLSDIAVSADGAFVGRVFFTGSPCAVWANFSGRIYGDTAVLSMYVGNCGLDEVTLHRQGPGWTGTYRAQYPDEGTVEMVD